jgi:hypothetical protein
MAEPTTRVGKMFAQLRFPYLRRRRMKRALGPDLAAITSWQAADEPLPGGDLAAIYDDVENVHKWLHYLPVYEAALAPYRDGPIRMLEIGVFRGGSLQIWRRYLHQESVIVGVDIDPNTAQYDDPERGIHVRVGSQVDIGFLKRVVDELGPFNVILDDGSHMSSHMIDTFRYLFPNALVDGGVYIVEDIHANYWQPYRDTSMTFADFTRWLTDAMHAHYQRYRAEVDYRVGGPSRRAAYQVPFATTIIDHIEVQDSMTLVYRKRRIPPRTVFK